MEYQVWKYPEGSKVVTLFTWIYAIHRNYEKRHPLDAARLFKIVQGTFKVMRPVMDVHGDRKVEIIRRHPNAAKQWALVVPYLDEIMQQ